MSKINKILLLSLVILLTLVNASIYIEASHYKYKVYFNEEEKAFYRKRVGTDGKGTYYGPYVGEIDEEAIKELEEKYTKSTHDTLELIAERNRKRAMIFFIVLSLLTLIIFFFLIKLIVKLFRKIIGVK
mgnify:FL=1